MVLDLTGVYAKLDRAYDHLEALEQEAIHFMERKPYGLGKDVEDEGRRHIGTLNVYRQPGINFGILIGDCASNFRAALDHLVFAVARDVLDSATLKSVGGNLMFPISTDPNTWPKTADYRLNGIPDVIRACIKGHQPYTTHNPAKDAPLYAVHWINNRDKHRVVHAVTGSVAPTRAKVDINPPVSRDKIVKYEVADGLLIEDGTQVIKIEFSEPVPQVDMDCDIVLQIFIREISTSKDIREILTEAGQHIQRIVANVIGKEIPRDPISHLT